MPAAAALAAIPTSLMVGFALMLLLFAYSILFQKPLTKLLGGLPVVGGAIAGAVSAGLGSLLSWATSMAKNSLGQVVAWATRIPLLLEYGFVQVNAAIDAAISYTQQVAKVAGGAVGDVARRVDQALAKAAALASQVASLLDRVASLSSKVAKVISSTIPAAIATAEAAARSWAKAAIAAAVSALDKSIVSVRHWAAQAIDSAVVQVGRAIDSLRVDLVRGIDQVRLALDAQVQAIGRAIDQLGLRLDGRIDGLVGALAPLLALELTRVIPALRTQVDTMERECVTPTCSAMRPNLDALNALNDGLMLAAILGLAAEAYRDPEGMAQATVGFTHGIESAAADVLGTFGVGS